MASSRFTLPLVLILICASTAPIAAQDDLEPKIEALLVNRDPRLVAIGARLAGLSPDEHSLAIMEERVEHWDPAQRNRALGSEGFDAMTEILDALIQQNRVVSPAGVAAIAYAFPDQALILAARLPFDDAEPMYLSWYEEGAQTSNPSAADSVIPDHHMLARVAAMMVVHKRPQDIAANILADSTEMLVVSVPIDRAQPVDRCLIGCTVPPRCALEIAGEARTGWPPVFQYIVEENSPYPVDDGPPELNHLLVQIKGDRITFRRVKPNTPPNYCYSPAPLNPLTFHRLLAQMLGVSDEKMTWQAQESGSLGWVSDKQFLSELGTQVGLEEAGLRATVQKVYAKGLITKSQAETTRPKLSIVVYDDRGRTRRPAAPLPQLPVSDSRTTYRIATQP